MKIRQQAVYFAFLGVIFLLSAASNQFFIERITSDYLNLFETAGNLLHFKTLSGQNFSAAPYFFPDILVMMLLTMMTQNLTVLHFVYSLLFLSFYSTIVYLLMKVSLNNKMLSFWGSLIALMLGFLVLPAELTFLRDWPGSHLSALFFGLYLLYFYVTHLQSKPAIGSMFVLFTLTFLIFVSDNILFIQALFPLSLIIVADMVLNKINRKMGLSLLLVFLLTVLLGARFDWFLTEFFNASYSLNVSLYRIRHIGQLIDTLGNAYALVAENIRLHPGYYFLLLYYNIAGLVFAGMLYVKTRHKQDLTVFFRVLAFLYLAQICNVFLAVLAGKLSVYAHFRYLDSIYFFPSIAFAWTMIHCVANKLHTRFFISLVILLVIISLAGFLKINGQPLRHFTLQPPYNSFVACVDGIAKKFPIKNGLAEYWEVREVRMLSKHPVMITQISPELEFVNLMDNKARFYADPAAKTPFTYQFIIINPHSINPLPQNRIRESVGEPDQTIVCEGREVWLYVTKEKEKKLNDFFKRKIQGLT